MPPNQVISHLDIHLHRELSVAQLHGRGLNIFLVSTTIIDIAIIITIITTVVVNSFVVLIVIYHRHCRRMFLEEHNNHFHQVSRSFENLRRRSLNHSAIGTTSILKSQERVKECAP